MSSGFHSGHGSNRLIQVSYFQAWIETSTTLNFKRILYGFSASFGFGASIFGPCRGIIVRIVERMYSNKRNYYSRYNLVFIAVPPGIIDAQL